MKTWEKLLYAFAVLIGAFLFILWMDLVFFDRTMGGALWTFKVLVVGLGSLLFFVPFLDAPLKGTTPLYKKWYGWFLAAAIVVILLTL